MPTIVAISIFQCQRRAEKEYPQGRGLPKQRMNKYTIGGSSLFSIIAIIWFPLVLFALGNTVGLPNNPLDVSLEISIGSYQPIYTMSAQRNDLVPWVRHTIIITWNEDESQSDSESNLKKYAIHDSWRVPQIMDCRYFWNFVIPGRNFMMRLKSYYFLPDSPLQTGPNSITTIDATRPVNTFWVITSLKTFT